MTYAIFSADNFDFKGAKTGFYLIYVDIIVVLFVLYTVAKKFVELFYAQKHGISGSRFHIRLVSIFSLLTIIPSVIMSVFAIVFFHGGMDAWFTQKNKTVLNESLRVAEAYLKEHTELIKDDAVAVANMLETKLPVLPNDFELRSKFLRNMLRLRGLSEGLLVDSNLNVIARTDFGFSLEFQVITRAILDEAVEKQVVLLKTDDKKHIFALTVLDFQEQLFLLVKKPVDDKVITHVENTKEAVEEYFAVQNERQSLEIGFALLFLLTAILLVVSAIGIAFNLASRIITPISNLIDASERIRDGNLEARVTPVAHYDELNILNRAFNDMIDRIQEQHKDLVRINKDLDSRMQFIENVLYNISSGVLGLKTSMKVYIANKSAKGLLKVSENSEITTIFPEILPLCKKALSTPDTVVEGNIIRTKLGHEQTLRVRVIYDHIKVNGLVVTIDDLTEISLAQKKAAWSDVARSVAHEIKNPLTPIKLAAERIEKKYLHTLTDKGEQDILHNLITTIVKHSDNIKRLVDEFSMFARLPEPVRNMNDIVSICESSVLFAQNTYNWLKFTFKSHVKSLPISCDENLIRQVLNNLLKNSANALEYAGKNGMIIENPEIALSIAPSTDDFISIKVSDNGPGFSEEYQQRLLQPYFSLTPNGTGLGLVISNKIIIDHGGKMNLTNNTVSGGAIVEVLLPC